MDRVDWLRVAGVIRDDLEQYLLSHHLQALVLGISGGIDSAVTAVLAAGVCKVLGIPLIGRSIPIESNGAGEQERARLTGTAFCSDFREADLSGLYTIVRDTVEEESLSHPEQSDKVRRGNIKARLRMIYLYNLAQRYRGMVLSTDNRTEYMLGFWTLHGDVGDYAPLFGLWKTEVYKLACALKTEETEEWKAAALQACIEAVPTDGLGISSSDVEQLGALDYREVDDSLQAYESGENREMNRTVIQRHLDSGYKRNNPRVVTRWMLGLEGGNDYEIYKDARHRQ